MPSAIVHASFISNSGVIISDDTISSVEQCGLEYLGSGISRRVFALDEQHVLKLERGYYKTCNKTERDGWLAIADTPMAVHFAPVVACSPSGEWLVMRRAESKLDSYTFSQWSNTTGRALNRAGCTDLHSGNVMEMRDGSVKVIDYGFDNLDASRFDSSGVGGNGSYDSDGTCRCDDCLAEQSAYRHASQTCSHRLSNGHGSCARCGFSACHTPTCVIRRDTQFCEASNGCDGALAGYWGQTGATVAFFCRDHLPYIGPLPCTDNGHVRMFWQLTGKNIARLMHDTNGVRHIMRTF